MTLKQYLDEHDISIAEFSRRIGTNRQTVRNWVNGTHMPRRCWHDRIRKATGYRVDHMGIYQGVLTPRR